MSKDNKELTIKQKKFVEALPESTSIAEASRKAGYKSVSARVRGWENLSKPEVAEALEQRYEKIQKAADVTLDSLIQELQEARELASSQKNPNALTAAIMAKAKLTGFDINRNLDLTAKSDTEVLEALYEGGTLQELIALHHSKTGKYLIESDTPELRKAI